jgi:hypothetical protein
MVRQTVKNVGEKVKDVVEQASEALDKKDNPSSASALPQMNLTAQSYR